MKKNRQGLTLIELIVVVAILAVLAMIVLPKLDGLQGNANHAVGASSANDTARYIQTYRATKLTLPDGYDSLMSGSSLWQAGYTATSTTGLHPQLCSGTSPKLLATTLSPEEASSLTNAGILHLFNLPSTTHTSNSKRPSDAFTQQVPVASSLPVAVVNNSNAAGMKIIDRVYRTNMTQTGSSGATPSGTRLLAVGLGPQNAMVGKLMMEAPYYPNVDQTYVYGRNLVLFEIGGSRAIFKGVLGADGDILDDLTTYMSRDLQ